jgi:hypothetical protein
VREESEYSFIHHDRYQTRPGIQATTVSLCSLVDENRCYSSVYIDDEIMVVVTIGSSTKQIESFIVHGNESQYSNCGEEIERTMA